MEIIIVSLFALIMGLAFCFWGYRVFLVLLPIWGFFAGLWLGASAITLLFGDGFLATTTGWVVGFIAGLVLAILSYLFYMLGVALVAGAIGWALASGLLAVIGLNSGIILFAISLVMAIVVIMVVLVLNVQKYVVIVLTAVSGANALLLSLLLLLGKVTTDMLQASGNPIQPVLQDSWFWAIGWLILAGVGIFFQIKTNRAYEFSKENYHADWG
jgi:hypothetical protein